MTISDGVLTQLILSATSIVISIVTGIVTVVVAKKVDKTDKKVDNVSTQVNMVQKQTNGLTDKLVAATAENAYNAGKQARRLEDKDSDLGTLR